MATCGLAISLITIEFFFFGLPYFLPYILYAGYDVDMLEKLGQVGDSFGIYNALFSLLALGGVVITLLLQVSNKKHQSVIDQYFKMIDTHFNILASIRVYPVKVDRPYSKENTVIPEKCDGSRAFIEYKAQLSRLLGIVKNIVEDKNLTLSECDVADVAYICLYYGVDKLWEKTLQDVLSGYDNSTVLVQELIARVGKERNYRLGRTNQNYLSMYFRNIYNAVKLIDESDLDEVDKQKYIKILRAQLSNAELYVLFFNVLSRYGTNWVNKGFVKKYDLFQNMPALYCDGYEPRIYFPETKYESEILKKSPFSKY